MSRRVRVQSIPYGDWPTKDRCAWEDALKYQGPFERCGTACRWSEATRHTNRARYALWLDHLQRRGLLSPDLEPIERINPSNVRSFVEELELRTAPCSVASAVIGLKVVAKAFAPRADWQWLAQISNALNARAVPRTDKRSRMVSLDRVLNAALTEMERLLRTPLTRRIERVAFRDALMISLIALRPLRLKNFYAIEIRRHLDNLHNKPTLFIPADETKNKAGHESDFPEALLPFLQIYLDRVRPSFNRRPPSNRLWLTFEGDPISKNETYYRITILTKRLLGVAINPHLFRDIAATELAMSCPEGIFLAASLLGHRNLRTTEYHYVQSNRIIAGQAIAKVIDKLRRNS